MNHQILLANIRGNVWQSVKRICISISDLQCQYSAEYWRKDMITLACRSWDVSDGANRIFSQILHQWPAQFCFLHLRLATILVVAENRKIKKKINECYLGNSSKWHGWLSQLYDCYMYLVSWDHMEYHLWILLKLNSITICHAKTKEIITVTVVWISDPLA